MIDDIVVFIRARLYKDEVLAKDALSEWPPGDEVAGQTEGILVGAHVARHDPARVLRGVVAKRRIVDEHHQADPCDAHDAEFNSVACETLLLLASEWSTHESYRAEWTP